MRTSAIISFLVCLLNGPLIAQNSADGFHTFQYNLLTLARRPLTADTAAPGSQIHHPLYAISDSWTELGNTGLPAIPNQYQPLSNALTPLSFQAYRSYNQYPDNLKFYAVNSPFSMINYNSGGTGDKNGQTINAVYGRNLKNNSNITAFARYINSDGHVKNQASSMSVIDLNYLTERKRYSLFTGFSRSGFKSGENGGLASDESLPGTSTTEFLPVNLDDASSKTTFLSIRGIQAFDLGTEVPPDTLTGGKDSTTVFVKSGKRIIHRFRINDYYRFYFDKDPSGGFYTSIYRDSTETADSTRFSSWQNEILFQDDSVSLLGRHLSWSSGVTPDIFRYAFTDTSRIGFNLGLAGTADLRDSLTNFGLRGSLILAGYASGDYNFMFSFARIKPGNSTDPVFSVVAQTKAVSPDPLIRNFESNHFAWTNHFTRQYENSLTIAWSMPRWDLDQQIRIILNKGLVYFDHTGIPDQFTGFIPVFEVATAKKFKWGPFRSNIRLTLQKSFGDQVRLPLITAGTNTFMHHDIHFEKTHGLLELEYGLDARFNTAFYGYAFMPATGTFYLQDGKLIGNYPYLDVFAMIKVKRTRIFVQWCHTFAIMMPEESFAALHYPYMRPHLKYGVYWHFYD